MLGSAGLHKPMHLSSAYKPCSATFLQPRAGTVLVGYMRVSTSEQNLALQRDALAGAGCDRFYEDICSGSVTERPGLSRALDHLRSGDALVVWKLDRIGRSLGHVVELVDGLQSKGIGLKVLTGGIDTTSSTGRLVFGIFATLAEYVERAIMRSGIALPWGPSGIHRRGAPHNSGLQGGALA